MRERAILVVLALLGMSTLGAAATLPLRPGDPLGPDESCTLGFVLLDVSGNAHMVTAAHCVDAGLRVSSPQHGEIGTVVWASESLDTAFIRLDADEPWAKEGWGIGAPTGLAGSADLETGDVLRFHGVGIGFSVVNETRTREGVLVGRDQAHFWWDTVALPGDSGAPVVLANGKAVGIVSEVGAFHLATDVGGRLDAAIAAARASGLDLHLA